MVEVRGLGEGDADDEKLVPFQSGNPNVPSRVVNPESTTATMTPPPALRLMSQACGMLMSGRFHCWE